MSTANLSANAFSAGAGMTAHEGALSLQVKQKMLDGIEHKHGSAMNDFWQETFSYGIEQLTQGEAGHLRAAPSVDALRNRLIQARHAASANANAPAPEAAASESVNTSLRQQFEKGLAQLQVGASQAAPDDLDDEAPVISNAPKLGWR